jgi:predicted metal-dependent hydrolase
VPLSSSWLLPVRAHGRIYAFTDLDVNMPSHISLKRLYNHFNKKYFNNELPADTQIMWHPMDSAHGQCWTEEHIIHLDPPLQSNVRFTKIILLHEMCHLIHNHHGKEFHAEIARLFAAGAYKQLV